MTTKDIRNYINRKAARSAWAKGVNAYAFELLDDLDEAIENGYFDAEDINAPKLLMRQLLNGASDWSQYSWGGCSLIYNGDIAIHAHGSAVVRLHLHISRWKQLMASSRGEALLYAQGKRHDRKRNSEQGSGVHL